MFYFLIYRSDQERTVQKVCNTVPFVLQKGSYSIEVLEPLSADILDMDVVSNTFEPSASSIADHLWGFFTGTRFSLLTVHYNKHAS